MINKDVVRLQEAYESVRNEAYNPADHDAGPILALGGMAIGYLVNIIWPKVKEMVRPQEERAILSAFKDPDFAEAAKNYVRQLDSTSRQRLVVLLRAKHEFMLSPVDSHEEASHKEDLISNIINTIRDNPPKEITHSL